MLCEIFIYLTDIVMDTLLAESKDKHINHQF